MKPAYVRVSVPADLAERTFIKRIAGCRENCCEPGLGPLAGGPWHHSRVWGAALGFLSGPAGPELRTPPLRPGSLILLPQPLLQEWLPLSPGSWLRHMASWGRCAWFGPLPVPLARESETLTGWVWVMRESSASWQNSQGGKFFRRRKGEGVLINSSQMRRDVVENAAWSMVAARYEWESFASNRLLLIRRRWLCFFCS